jgi:glucokinase
MSVSGARKTQQNVCQRVARHMKQPERLIMAGSLGGTHIRWALISNKGRLLEKVDIPTDEFSSQAQLVGRLVEVKKWIKGTSRVRFGGMGIPCPIDEKTGEAKVAHPANITKFGFQGVFRALSRRLGIPIFGYNDAQVDAMGEAMFGAGRWHNKVVFSGLGTGYGFGMVFGEMAFATEFGHAPAVKPSVNTEGDPRLCGCGSRWGCVEKYASGSALAEDFLNLTHTRLTGVEVGEAFLAGDRRAEQVVRNAMTYLAKNIAIANLFAQGALHIVGGGVSSLGEPLMRILTEQMQELSKKEMVAWPNMMPEVVLAELPQDAGLYGAGVLAEQAFMSRA